MHDGVRRLIGRRLLHDGRMQVRVERLAQRFDLLAVMPRQDAFELLRDELHAFEQARRVGASSRPRRWRDRCCRRPAANRRARAASRVAALVVHFLAEPLANVFQLGLRRKRAVLGLVQLGSAAAPADPGVGSPAFIVVGVGFAESIVPVVVDLRFVPSAYRPSSRLGGSSSPVK